MEDFPPNRAAAKGTRYEHLFDTPAHWPDDVHYLTMDNMGMLGRRARTNQLLWDGHALVTERRLANFERWLAVVTLVLAGIGVAATVAQAWAAWLSVPP